MMMIMFLRVVLTNVGNGDDDDDDDVGDDDDDVGDDCDVDLNPLSPISAGETDQHGGQLRIDRPKQLAWISP